MDILKGDVVVLNMDDELLLVGVVFGDGTFAVYDPVKPVDTGLTEVGCWHEYENNDVMTVYREVK